MNCCRLFLIALTVAAAIPLAAEEPTAADRPSANTSCDFETCEKAAEALAQAKDQINLALDDMPEALHTSNLVVLPTAVDPCNERRAVDADRKANKKAGEKIRKEYPEWGGLKYVLSAQAWLDVTKEWLEFEDLCARSQAPLMVLHSHVDYQEDLSEKQVVELLAKLDAPQRKSTREALLRSSHRRCSERNRQLIISLIDANGAIRKQ